jgi:rod shape-determining protein MreD
VRRRGLLSVLVPILVSLLFLGHPGLGFGSVAPDLLVVALLLAAREVGMGWGTGLGFALGLLEDSFSVLSFGANTVALTLVGALGARTRDLFVGDSLSFVFWYLAVGKLLREVVRWVVVGEALREPFLGAILLQGAASALYAGVVGMILFLPFRGRNTLP